MNKITEILNDYTAGVKTLEEANSALKELNAGFHLDPNKNVISEAEMAATTVSDDPSAVTGFGMLDMGIGSMEKVEIKNGELVNCDMGDSYALVLVGGKVFRVKGKTLVRHNA